MPCGISEVLLGIIIVRSPCYEDIFTGGTPPKGGGRKPLHSQSSPIAMAMRSSFELRFLRPALLGRSTTPREHVLYESDEIQDITVKLSGASPLISPRRMDNFN